MTGLPQTFGTMKRRIQEADVPVEVRLWSQTLEDARRYQASARFNAGVVYLRRERDLWWGPLASSTEALAAEQYAYVRWLMGIDDYWLSIRKSVRPRPDHERLPHQRLDVRTPGAA